MRPDNVTPPTRTPWGGRIIRERLKRGLSLPGAGDAVVGESWEVSVEPSFPSRFADDDGLLAQAIAADPVAWLGAAGAERYDGQTPLLVKLLDAADNLSVQVHPRADDPALAADESGKPEGWYVLAAAPGAGLYLGFEDGVERADVAACLRARGPLDEFMNFVPVAAGDGFVLPAGTAHAIGAGVTLVEPQLVHPGRRGLTYRLWDWNRRYDQHGRPSPTGQARELHVTRSLAVNDWAGPRGRELLARCRQTPRLVERGPLSRTRVLSWSHFTTERWAGRGALDLDTGDELVALVCVAGAAEIASAAGTLTLSRGQSAVIPAHTGRFSVHTRAHPQDGDVAVDILATRAGDIRP